MLATAQARALKLTPDQVKRSLLRTLLVLAGFVAAWPVVRHVYRPAYAELGAAAVNLVGTDITIVPEAQTGGTIARDTPLMDTVFHFDHKTYGRGGGAIPASSFYHAYLPTAILVALMWGARRGNLGSKKKVLILALLALHVFLVLRLSSAVALQLAASTVDGAPVLALGEWSSRTLRYVKDLFWDNAISTILVPILIWALFAFDQAPEETAG